MTVWIVLVQLSIMGEVPPSDLYMNAVFSTRAACETFVHRVPGQGGVQQHIYCHPEKVRS